MLSEEDVSRGELMDSLHPSQIVFAALLYFFCIHMLAPKGHALCTYTYIFAGGLYLPEVRTLL
jgi:hypothetical protein